MSGNNGKYNSGDTQRLVDYGFIVDDTRRMFGLPLLERIKERYKPIERAMTTKIILWLFYGIGLPAYAYSLLKAWGVFLFSLGDVKEFIIFTVGILLLIARGVIMCAEALQRYRYRQDKMDNERAKRDKQNFKDY